MDGLPVLDALDQRILGALMEKQVTVPASYPLSLNALQTACNQTTSREPVSAYTAQEIETRCRELKERGLVRIVWSGAGSRVLKYHQRLTEVLDLANDERALVTLLLLRGAQAPGELKTRAERLHAFGDRADVEEVLGRMAARTEPLVWEVPRRAGQHDPRWMHLLGPAPAVAESAEPAVDRDMVLADGAQARDARVRTAYGKLAVAYADELSDELAHKPFDRWLLGRIAQESNGPVADIGCGPGHTTAALADAGAEVVGFDFAPEMIAQARERHPGAAFEVGDFGRLLRPSHASAWGAITAWYAFVHLSGSELAGVLAGLRRITAPDGLLAFSVHVGNAVHHVDELFGVATDLDFVLHDRQDVLAAVAAAGARVEEWYVRGPGAAEAEAERLYVVARA